MVRILAEALLLNVIMALLMVKTVVNPCELCKHFGIICVDDCFGTMEHCPKQVVILMFIVKTSNFYGLFLGFCFLPAFILVYVDAVYRQFRDE